LVKRGAIGEFARQAPSDGALAQVIQALPTLIKMLSDTIEAEAVYPTRRELHRRLEAIEKSARLLIQELPDLRILALLLDGDARIENENETYHGLHDISARAARVRKRNPLKQGRGRLYPKSAIGVGAMELCALIVAVCHHHESGKWPGKDNAKAHQLCEALWKAAGGPPRLGRGKPRLPSPLKETKAEKSWGKSGSATVAVWRNHLKTGRNYRPPHPAGAHIQRILVPVVPRRPVPRRSLYNYPASHPKGGTKKPV
jgi:hypothetical protein